MQYLAPGLTLIIAHGIIWIIVAFWLIGVYLCPTQIIVFPKSLQSWSNERYSCSGLTYGLLVVQYLAKCPRPDFNNGLGDNLNRGCILAPSVYSILIRFMSSRQAIPILERGKRLPQLALSPPCWFREFSRQNTLRRALRKLKVLTKIVLTTPHPQEGTSILGGRGAWPQNLPLKFLLEPQILPPKI